MKLLEISAQEFGKIQARDNVYQEGTALFERDSSNLIAFIWDDDSNDDLVELKYYKVVN